MARTVEIFYDVGSPYSYLASTQVEALVARHEAVLAWRPFLLGGVFKAVGTGGPSGLSPAKARWELRDLKAWAKRYDVPFQMNPRFPVNTLKAMRMIVAAEERGHQVPLLHALFHAMWAEARDVSDPEVLRAVADEAGLPGRMLLERTEAGHVKERLKASTAEAVERGAFGAPTLFVGDTMFFGNDRLSFVEAALDA